MRKLLLDRRAGTVCVPLVVPMLAALLLLPDLLFGLDRHGPFAQLVSFRPVLVLGVLAAAPAIAVVRRPGPGRWLHLVGLGVVLFVAATSVLPRVIADPPASGGRPFAVLSFNTLEGSADMEVLRELIRTSRPDVVSLSEAGEGFRLRLAPAVEPLGYTVHTATGPEASEMSGVTAVVAGGLGDVRVHIGDDTSLPHLAIGGGGLGEVRVVVFHALAPLPGLMSAWRGDLAQLARWCSGPTPAVVAGDLNATLDHSVLRDGMSGCADSADQRGAGLIPTWSPSAWMRPIGPQIDHVIVTEGIETESFDVVDIPGSDHRAVFSRLRLPT